MAAVLCNPNITCAVQIAKYVMEPFDVAIYVDAPCKWP